MTNTPPIQRQRPHYVTWDCGTKRTNTPYKTKRNRPPHLGRRSTLIQFVTAQPNYVDIVRFEPKADNIYIVRTDQLQIVLELILDPSVGIRLAHNEFCPITSWDKTRILCLYEGVFVSSYPSSVGEKISSIV